LSSTASLKRISEGLAPSIIPGGGGLIDLLCQRECWCRAAFAEFRKPSPGAWRSGKRVAASTSPCPITFEMPSPGDGGLREAIFTVTKALSYRPKVIYSDPKLSIRWFSLAPRPRSTVATPK
jgi:hypothetical protein